MNNVRFATAIHILTLLQQHPDELLSSAYIAGSININPAIVRKEMSNLSELGLIETKEGKGGGSYLAKDARKIKFDEVYKAVNQNPVLGRTNDPNPACKVGKQINKHIDTLYEAAEQALLKKLSSVNLFDFCSQFK